MISFSIVEIFDLFLRFSSIGLILGAVMMLRRFPLSNITFPIHFLLGSQISYICLTAPLDTQYFGSFRRVFILFSDIGAYALLWLTLAMLDKKFSLSKVNKLILVPIIFWMLILTYFFLVTGGYGILHDVNHALILVVFACVIYLCFKEYFDDLVEQRRNYRVLISAISVGYMIVIVGFEFAPKEVRDIWKFSIGNGTIMFVFSLLITNQIASKLQPIQLYQPKKNKTSSKELQAIQSLIEHDGYLKTNLTITALAKELDIPAHRLREVINQELSFTNFSQFLNSYRIPYICEQLKNPDKKHIPILTLALEAGYGSIAPFNRAFKQLMGMTPKEYRDQF